MATVRFDKVTKRFGETVAVRELDLDIPDREFLVLVGPSGCGKSTTLRMLAGLESVTEGRIYIGDRDVTNVRARDRDIAMVFQSYALYPHMSVYDNMAFALTLRKTSKDEVRRRVEEVARILGIEELLQRKPGQLSGGQRQRVALGRAIVRQPAVFLLDEPLSNLDAKLRVQTRAEISKLHRRLATTFIYVTHDQIEAMTMATRIAVMNNGSLQQVGPPDVLYDHPRNLFVAGFIGSPAINTFSGTVVRAGEELRIDTGSFAIPIRTKASALSAYLGKQVIFGVRPEHVHNLAYLPPGIESATVPAEVDVAELLGNEVMLHLVLPGNARCVARVDPRTRARPGQHIEVGFDLAQLHVFDPQSELAIAETAPAVPSIGTASS
ncbi:MAG TPA: ABC transporter ATP-binding protein [Dehalococcoidia bacterium]|nr:ABC transporter ATP-binding protein [Dehalococcoidia bacterium]